MIEYTFEKKFNIEDVVRLFKSHNWESAEYPTRLYKALMNSENVVTAWDGDRLVGLARAIDDSEMVAYIHYVIVLTGYEGMGIASRMIEMLKDVYKDYLYIKVIPANSNVVDFYKKLGFKIKADGIAMQIVNEGVKR